MSNLLKEAIADAKTVRETAIANAKMALEEAFTPHLKSMLSAKLSEDEVEEGFEDEITAEEMDDDEDPEEAMHDKNRREDDDDEIDEMGHEDDEDPEEVLSKTFEQVEGYDEMVIVKGIRVESHCEHHMVPILGVAHVGYIPDQRVVGISKLARIIDIFGKRLQTQETMTAQVADTINNVLKPKGVAVVIDAAHQCMTTRGIHKTETSTVTSRMLGVFKENAITRTEFMNLIHSNSNQS